MAFEWSSFASDVDWGSLLSSGYSLLAGNNYDEQADYALSSGKANAEIQAANAELARYEGQILLAVGNYNAEALTNQAGSVLQIAEANALELEREATYQRWLGEFKENRLWREVDRLVGRQTVAFAAAGLTDVGTPVDLMVDTVKEAGIDAFLIRDEARELARRATAQAEITRMEGQAKADTLLDQARLSQIEAGYSAEAKSRSAAIYDMGADLASTQGSQTASAQRSRGSAATIGAGISLLGTVASAIW